MKEDKHENSVAKQDENFAAAQNAAVSDGQTTLAESEQSAASQANVVVAPQDKPSGKSAVKERIKNVFSTRNLTTVAVLAAIGYGLCWLEFPIFPAAPFLKLDFSNLATMLAGYTTGPFGAVVVEAFKQLMCWWTKSGTGGVGEIANFLMGMAFALPPSVLYLFKKGIGWVSVGMSIGCVCQIATAMLCNRYITFTLFFGEQAGLQFADLWVWLLAFNAIKSVAVSILTFLLYKRLSVALKWIFKPRKKRKTLAKSESNVYNNGMESVTITTSAEETAATAARLAKGFVGGEVVLLTGDLGAGKTVFAKGVAEALGVREEVKSPTFTLCCEYRGANLTLVHIDAYRLKNGEEAEACGLNEKFGDPSVVCLIEWPSQIESVLPKRAISVKIDRISDNERKITTNVNE